MDNNREELLSEALESSFEQSPQSTENFLPATGDASCLQAPVEEATEEVTQTPVEEEFAEAIEMTVESELPVQETVGPEMPLCEPRTEVVPVCPPPVPPDPFTQGSYGYYPDPYRGTTEQAPSPPYGAFPPNPYTQGATPHGQPYAPNVPGAYSNIPGGNYGQGSPYGQPTYYGQGPVQNYRMPPVPQKSRKGLASMIFGILALVSSYFIPIVSCVLGIIALVFGVQTVKDKKAHEQERIFGIAGLVFGALGILVSLVLTVVTFIKFFDLLSQIEGLGEHKPM